MFMDWEIHEHYVTFGVQYTGDERNGEIHPLGFTHRQYVVIEAPSLDMAQRIAGAIFGNTYSMCYPASEYTHKYQPEGEALRIAWESPHDWSQVGGERQHDASYDKGWDDAAEEARS